MTPDPLPAWLRMEPSAYAERYDIADPVVGAASAKWGSVNLAYCHTCDVAQSDPECFMCGLTCHQRLRGSLSDSQPRVVVASWRPEQMTAARAAVGC